MEKKISRYGAYGLLLKDDLIFLTRKNSGPYEKLWGLPGGAIEFGESPEEAVKREFLEEAAIAVDRVELFCIATVNGTYENDGALIHFHHVGIIYHINGSSLVSHLIPEEEGCWLSLADIDQDQLTPFAIHVLMKFKHFASFTT